MIQPPIFLLMVAGCFPQVLSGWKPLSSKATMFVRASHEDRQKIMNRINNTGLNCNYVQCNSSWGIWSLDEHFGGTAGYRKEVREHSVRTEKDVHERQRWHDGLRQEREGWWAAICCLSSSDNRMLFSFYVFIVLFQQVGLGFWTCL